MFQATGALVKATAPELRGGDDGVGSRATANGVDGTAGVSISEDAPHDGANHDSATDAGAPHNGAADDHSAARPRVSVVIPALNEAENLPHVLPRIPIWVHEVLLVDGSSTDGTSEVARRLYPSIRLVKQEGRGKGAALRSGFAAARGDIIVMLDADGSTDPAEIPSFVDAVRDGADLAKGSRFLTGGGTDDMSLLRRLGNGTFVALVRVLFGGRFSDLCYGYNAIRAAVLPRLALDVEGFEIETLLNVRALRAGLRIVEVPSFEARRVHGEGRLRTFPDGWRVLRTIGREWRSALRGDTAPAQWRPASRPAERVRPLAEV